MFGAQFCRVALTSTLWFQPPPGEVGEGESMDPRLRAVRASRPSQMQGPAAQQLDISALLGRCLRHGAKESLPGAGGTRGGWRARVLPTPGGSHSRPQGHGQAAADLPTPSGRPGPGPVRRITVDLRAALARVHEPPEEIGDPPGEGDSPPPGGPTPPGADPSPPDPRTPEVDPSGLDPSHRDASRVDPFQGNPSLLDPSRVDPSRLDPSWVDLSQVDPSQGDPSRRNPSRVDPSRVDPSRRNPCWVDPSRVDPSHGDPSWVDHSQVDPSQGDPSPRSTMTQNKTKRQRQAVPRGSPQSCAKREGLWKMKMSLPALVNPPPLPGSPHGAGAIADHRDPPVGTSFVSLPKLLRTGSSWSSQKEIRSPDPQTKGMDPSFIKSVEESAIPFHQLLHQMRKRTSRVNHVLITEVLKSLREDLWSVPEQPEHSHLNYFHAQHFRRDAPFQQRAENRAEVKTKCTWQASDQFGNKLPVRISLFTNRSL
ncbi:proline-rich receptor-like protein kinase PERK10 isoform X2 [Chiloscyllium plagiosum]|uniref:proline-rich receptor-like protein kinase PERK10 isoform X2 n=1 Tax=Chiloscyllium plagiosum TaxID=36176 RepID=UPI001CB7DA7D|nr:proline-rich receptor-like protein kinase PERK10 isoform X2 [Chiloscyllium plagiosum]